MHFGLFRKQQLSVFWHTISYILFVLWEASENRSLVYDLSSVERVQEAMETDLQLFSQAFMSFDLTSATISKWHLFTPIYKTDVQPSRMLIHKPFTLLAASVMDRGPLQTSSEAFALALRFYFPLSLLFYLPLAVWLLMLSVYVSPSSQPFWLQVFIELFHHTSTFSPINFYPKLTALLA